jgi:pilus assembly protein CpaE
MNECSVAFAVSSAEGLSSKNAKKYNKIIQEFSSSEECRLILQKEPTATAVVICAGKGGISPVNLAAAVCSDDPCRDVYLLEDKPTESLANRARAAGIRGIINSSQAQILLASDEDDRRKPEIRILPEVNAAPPIKYSNQGSVIGFFSGRGGVGKSTLALMTALAAQKRGARVALVDLDIQFGDLGFLAGNEPSSRIQRLPLAQLCQMQTLPHLSEDALTLVLAPEQPEQGELLATGFPTLLEELASQRDIVICNTGTFWSDVHACMVQHCNHLVFLMDQRATSIEACKQVVDLCLRLQTPQARFVFALNGCGRHAALTTQDVSLALGGVEVLGLADGGTLVDELLALGCPLELLSSGNAFIASLEGLLDRLIGNASKSALDHSSGAASQHRTTIIDFAVLKDFFKGAHRVAS